MIKSTVKPLSVTANTQSGCVEPTGVLSPGNSLLTGRNTINSGLDLTHQPANMTQILKGKRNRNNCKMSQRNGFYITYLLVYFNICMIIIDRSIATSKAIHLLSNPDEDQNELSLM